MPTHLTQADLATRWKLSPRTLERWRWLGEGPPFLKLGGKVLYRQEDVEAYEREHVQTGTAAAPEQRALVPIRLKVA